MYFYKLILHIVEVIKKRPIFFLVTLGFFGGLLSFFFALFSIPIPGTDGVIGFYRMVPPTQFEYFYLIFSAVMSALIVTVTFHRMRAKVSLDNEKKSKNDGIKGGASSFLGLATGLFGAVCPACLGINVLLLGNVFTAQLSFLIPYIFWVQFSGIALLIIGLYFVTKSSYEKICISCGVKSTNNDIPSSDVSTANKKFFIKILMILAVSFFIFQIFSIFSADIGVSSKNIKNDTFVANGKKIDIRATLEEVTPSEGFKTKVKWGNVVKKMVADGALDPVKLENILSKRYSQKMKPQWRRILAGENSNLEINNDNAVFMMYLLWTLAKENKNQILSDSPFVKYFKNYDIGVGHAGYGDLQLLSLTKAQQKIAKDVAENANRPCCNNSTAAPDCSHGYSALGLVELMASQGFSKAEIFDAFVKFNSFWFPETYIKDALYFNITKGEKWSDVDKEVIAGKEYSSLSGSYKVKNYLKKKLGI